MNCREIQKRLTEYIDDRLGEKTRSEMDMHFSDCGTCRRERDELIGAISELKSMPMVKAPDDFAFRLRQKLNRPSGLRKAIRFLSAPFGMKSPFGFATATAVAVVLLFVLQVQQPDKAVLQDHKSDTKSPRQMEGVALPEKKPDALSLDRAMPSAAKQTPSPEAARKTRPAPTVKGDTDLLKEQKGGGMAPEPTDREVQKPIQWVLTVGSTNGGGTSAATLQKTKTPGSRQFSGSAPDNLAMERRASDGGVENTRSDKDEDIRGPLFSMADAVARAETLTNRLGGKIISVRQTRHTRPKYFMTLLVPGEHVIELFTELGKIGVFDAQPEELSESVEDPVIIHLTVKDLR